MHLSVLSVSQNGLLPELRLSTVMVRIAREAVCNNLLFLFRKLSLVCEQVTLVINFDVPRALGSYEPAYETYLHRVGRTGRFKRKGVAFNLLSMTSREVGSLGSCYNVMHSISFS